MDIKRNKKAYLDYEHLETFEAGLVLYGAEVKAVKAGLISLDGSYVTIAGGEAWLVNAKISQYSKASSISRQTHSPGRKKRLLLTKKQIHYLVGKSAVKGLTLIPLSVYSTRRLVKLKLALAKGKRKFDKRAAIKEKEFKRRELTRVKR